MLVLYHNQAFITGGTYIHVFKEEAVETFYIFNTCNSLSLSPSPSLKRSSAPNFSMADNSSLLNGVFLFKNRKFLITKVIGN